MKFDRYRLDERILKSLTEERMIRATDIQHKAIPHILGGDDLLGIAQTGTGKTAAFAIPVLHKLINGKRKKGLRVLVMVPTRELAKQNADAFRMIGKHTRVKTTAIFGGVEQESQINTLKNGTDVLVATPGRMFDLISQGYITFDAVETLVVDEADQMLAHGFLEDIKQLMRHLPKVRQTLFFSATIDKEIKKLAYKLISQNAIRIEIAPESPISKNVEHCLAEVTMDEKRFYLEQLINEHPDSKMMVFVRTKVRAERVKKAMERVGIESETIHGDKEQTERLASLKAFREGKSRVLISTDVAARGIDIKGVEIVVNYDMPDVMENYVHRVGRTGRGEARGLAVSLCSDEEKDLVKEIEEFLGHVIPKLKKEDVHYDTILEKGREKENDWRSVIKEIELFEEEQKERKKKKKNRKKLKK
ncbi:DEAD/DEAH box helicase [Limibacter armeniacum]|uniref:DEAD/DEAH box helicase n=1 Tax=Limibacter armeniacum TaxID=466084 RepID=UPI002FE53367